MAEGKRSFKLYTDQRVFFEELPDELAGKMIKHLFKYVNDEYPPEDDLLIKLAFAPIKRQLKFDLKKYESIIERNRINGAKGGRPLGVKNPVGSLGKSGLIKNPNKPDKDKDKDNNKSMFIFDDFWKAYAKSRNKKKAEMKWKTLSEEVKAKIMKHVPMYVRSTPDKQLRKDPMTYLNNESWEDEIILPKKEKNTGIFGQKLLPN